MQSITITPAENLLQRLLKSEKLESKYAVSIEKKEGYTCLFLRLTTAETAPPPGLIRN
ncbi:MAG TPA: hypothetical protein VFT06_06445 [Flavisolibacter sp.]|jgi:hypothetical protein|nr:hypothetical protein [Flavisolibacter sp.]